MQRLTVCLVSLGLGLAVLSGCGADPTTSSAADEPTATTKDRDRDSARVNAENMIADCMKGKGFPYVPAPGSPDNESQGIRYSGRASVLEPAEQVKKFRTKYGFGLYSRTVYPTDPAVSEPAGKTNPNNAIREALDPSRQLAYDLALNGDEEGTEAGQKPKAGGQVGCGTEAAMKFFGSGPSQDQQAAAAREYAKFQNDPKMVAAASTYADCLSDKGFPVRSPQPGMVETTLYTQFNDEYTSAGGTGSGAAEAETSAVTLDSAAAKAGLAKEIEAALADLNCRTEYATLARTKWSSAIKAGNGVG